MPRRRYPTGPQYPEVTVAHRKLLTPECESSKRIYELSAEPPLAREQLSPQLSQGISRHPHPSHFREPQLPVDHRFSSISNRSLLVPLYFDSAVRKPPTPDRMRDKKPHTIYELPAEPPLHGEQPPPLPRRPQGHNIIAPRSRENRNTDGFQRQDGGAARAAKSSLPRCNPKICRVYKHLDRSQKRVRIMGRRGTMVKIDRKVFSDTVYRIIKCTYRMKVPDWNEPWKPLDGATRWCAYMKAVPYPTRRYINKIFPLNRRNLANTISGPYPQQPFVQDAFICPSSCKHNVG